MYNIYIYIYIYGKKQPYGDVWICPDLDSPLNMFTLDEDGFLIGFKPLDSGVPIFFM